MSSFFSGNGHHDVIETEQKLLLRPNEAELLLDLPEQAASNSVSRQPAQTSGVRKRLPFLMGVVTPLSSHLACA